ncbi:MAG TPA: competence/damage-inducible protein A [Vicinamibacteria bacterium]
MNAEILTIGSELLTPGRHDTNAAYLIEQLTSLGILVIHRATIPDDRRAIAEAAKQALIRADLVLATGGLGPTSDDVTREGFGDALGLALHVDEGVLETIRRRFERRGIAMPEVNRKQAEVLEGAEILANTLGTAPGMWITVPAATTPKKTAAAKEVILLPGPPPELHSVFESHVLARLAASAKGIAYVTKRTLVAGLPESVVEQKIGSIYRDIENPRTTILASPGQVEIHTVAKADTASEASATNEALASKIRAVLGNRIFSEAGESLEEVVGRMLVERSLSLAVAESCTGGLITHRLTQVAGSSRYLERGFVTYSNASKVELLGVDAELIRSHGAVSPEIAESMARGARTRAGTDIAIAVTGVAGPSGGTAEKPVGLVFIAVCDKDACVVRRFLFPGNRAQVKRWSSQMALDLLRWRLLGEEIPPF